MVNILPSDDVANYYGRVLDPDESARWFDSLLHTTHWKNDEVIIFGKCIVTKRKTAWYGDESYSYKYSNVSRQAMPWTGELATLKSLVENNVGCSFNSCLLNLYHSGAEGMSWHSDDEKELGKGNVIASLSLGAERKFSFKHKRSGEVISVLLENGSLLVMEGTTQENWLHALPKTKKVTTPRINLTFRNIIS